jgi:hypothetical protein
MFLSIITMKHNFFSLKMIINGYQDILLVFKGKNGQKYWWNHYIHFENELSQFIKTILQKNKMARIAQKIRKKYFLLEFIWVILFNRIIEHHLSTKCFEKLFFANMILNQMLMFWSDEHPLKSSFPWNCKVGN